MITVSRARRKSTVACTASSPLSLTTPRLRITWTGQDEIRKLLNVPGLMTTPFGPLNDENKLEHGISHEADENGINRTAFIFYLGDEKKVMRGETDSDKDGEQLAASCRSSLQANCYHRGRQSR